MDRVVVLPAFLALLLAQRMGPERTFIVFLVPVLIVLPPYFESELVPMTPEFTFSTATLAALFVVYLFAKNRTEMHLQRLDMLVLLHLFVVFLGQMSNSDYKQAQKVFFNDFVTRFLPYFMTRLIVVERKYRDDLLRVLVITGAVVGCFVLFEFRFWFNVFDDIIRRVWPHSVPWENDMRRYGFKRAAGPFGHPICAGYFFAMVLPLAVHLWKEKLVSNRTGMITAALCLGGCVGALSRAPLASVGLSLVILWYAHSKFRSLVVMIMVPAGVAALAVMLPAFLDYINVDRAGAVTVDQRNAVYRRELLDQYLVLVDRRPFLGWGRFTVPWVEGSKSIDNEYLFVALTSGKLALYLYLATIAGAFLALLAVFRRGSVAASVSRSSRLLAWALSASLLAAVLTQTTVFAGTQTVPIFYMFIGLAAGLAGDEHGDTIANEEIQPTGVHHGYQFSRTL